MPVPGVNGTMIVTFALGYAPCATAVPLAATMQTDDEAEQVRHGEPRQG